jgi:ribonuclease D
MSAVLNDPVWVAGPTAFRRMVETLSQQPTIAVDTESNSLFAYQEQVCLIQFSADELDFLVDPLSLPDLSELGPIFADPAIEKVFHAAEYDLICLKRDFGFEFNNLFDTMLAARIIGRTGLGLGTMLEEEFHVQVDKRFQRANWARRPIPEDMMAYARMDTHFLILLRDILSEQLIRVGRLGLAEEDFRRMTRVSPDHVNGGGCWRIPGAQDLTPRQAAVLMEVCSYREERARLVDQPPFRILPNQVLLEIAQLMPRKRSELNQVSGLSPKLIDRYGAGLIAAVERGIVGPPAYRPASQRPSDAILSRMEALRTWRKVTAREIGVESDVVLPREAVEDIARRGPRSVDELQQIMSELPWRFEHFGPQILKALGQS